MGTRNRITDWQRIGPQDSEKHGPRVQSLLAGGEVPLCMGPGQIHLNTASQVHGLGGTWCVVLSLPGLPLDQTEPRINGRTMWMTVFKAKPGSCHRKIHRHEVNAKKLQGYFLALVLIVGPLSPIREIHMVAHVCNPSSTQEAETGGCP